MKLIVVTDSGDPKHGALVEVDSNGKCEVICVGDDYHDRILAIMEGFVIALSYCHHDYEVVELEISDYCGISFLSEEFSVKGNCLFLGGELLGAIG